MEPLYTDSPVEPRGIASTFGPVLQHSQLREEEPYRGPVTDPFVYADYRLGNTTSSRGF